MMSLGLPTLECCTDRNKYQIKEPLKSHSKKYFLATNTLDLNSYVVLRKFDVFISELDSASNGFCVTIEEDMARELELLESTKQKNVIGLLQLAKIDATEFYAVFEYCNFALMDLLECKSIDFHVSDIKNIIQQILCGLLYIHSKKIVHADIQPCNILITDSGVVKIKSFGSAFRTSIRTDGQRRLTTLRLRYQPPEMILRHPYCSYPMDMWSFACLIAELWTRVPIMNGLEREEQIILIAQLCGPVTQDVWPDIQNSTNQKLLSLLSRYTHVTERKVKRRLISYVKDDHDACDLIDKMLVVNPKERYTAQQALSHDYFKSPPMASTNLDNLLQGYLSIKSAKSIRRKLMDEHAVMDILGGDKVAYVNLDE